MKYSCIVFLAFLATSLVAESGQVCRHPKICEGASSGNKDLVKCGNAGDVVAGFDTVEECEDATKSLNLEPNECYCIVWYIP